MLHTTEVTNWCVDLIGVKKTYGRKIKALRGINVQVRRGEIFGLLGPNGAGKSTLVKIMMTIVRPDEANGTILGRPIGNRKKLAVTGFLPELTAFPRYLTGLKVLDYCGALAKVPRGVRRKRAEDLLGRVGLSGWEDTRCGKYSKGMLRRLGLAQALINDPDLIVLDEPTDGLDPIGRREIRELVKGLRDAGKTVFLNSHLLSEIEMVCDRVTILDRGLVARQGTLAELTSRTVEFEIVATGDVAAAQPEVERLGGVVASGRIVSRSDDAERVNRIIDVLRRHKCLIESVEPHRFSLEDVFVEVVGERSERAIGDSSPVSTPR